MKYLTDKDNIVISSFDFTEKSTFFYFDSAVSQSKIDVEISVYDNSTQQLVNTYNLNFVDFNNSEFLTIIPASTDVLYGGLQVNTSNLLDSFGYIRGNYKVTYKFYFNILGTNENRLFIRKISSSRKEIIVDYIDKTLLDEYESFTDDNFYRFSQNYIFDKLLNFGSDNLQLILNSKNQSDAFGNSLILKLYKPLPAKFTNKDTLWIVSLLTDEIEDNVIIDFQTTEDVLDTVNILRAPNYLKLYNNIGTDYTTYKKYTDLIDTSSLGEKTFSAFNNTSSAEGIELNIKYQYFSNFVHFGSATQMLENFKNKLESIEHYSNAKITGSVSAGLAFSSSLYNKNKELEIIGGFTRYENFLYYGNEKYFTSSFYGTALIDATWPKNGVYLTSSLYPVSSSEAQNWYTTMSAIAFDYDYNNVNALIKTLPEYIINDILNNQQYISFVNMIGEFYDNIWIYVLSQQRMLKRENKFEDGVPGDIIWNILRNYGLNLNGGQNLVDLTRYKFGYNISGSTVTDLERTEQTVTHEIWNRILNNYPYIFKAKGTEKSIRSLFNCYGIPNSFIEIQEFGGPYTTSSFDSSAKYSFTYQDFTFVVQMTGSQYIYIPWQNSSYDSMVPDSIEFKVRTSPGAGDMDIFSLTGSSGEVKLQLINTVQEFGKFVLTVGGEEISSSVKPFYNNEFYSVLIKRSTESDNSGTPQNYYLSIKNHDDYINKIILNESKIISTTSSVTNDTYINATDFYLGGYPSSSQRFKGAFDEFRLWAEPLTDETFDFHTKYSLATNGNTISSSLSSLAFRLSFNTAYDLNLAPSMSNDAFDTASYGGVTASLGGFPALLYGDYRDFPYHFSDYERSNTVEQKFIAADLQNQKIRIEHNWIEYAGFETGSIPLYMLQGNYMVSDQKPFGEMGAFDNAPVDLDTLLIGFTPTEFINRDIIAFYGNNDILLAYGDFNNLYEASYPQNNFIVDTYWNNTKNGISFNDYLRYIRTYDRSLFDVVMELIPAKASVILGTVYEQNLLRRNRVKLQSPEIATNYTQYLFRINEKEYSILDDIIVNDLTSDAQIDVIKDRFLITSYDDLQALILHPISLLPLAFDDANAGEIIYKLNEYDLIAYNDAYINRQRTNTDRFRNLTNSTKNSSLTTTDRGPAVVLTSSSPKKLIVNYADNPKLIVK